MSPRLVLALLVAVAACTHGAWVPPPSSPAVWPLGSLEVATSPKKHNDDKQEVDPQIVGGHNARERQFPHQVSMQVWTEVERRAQHICGGTLIHVSWVLTAAHCTWGVPDMTNVRVQLGKLDLNDSGERGEQTIQVIQMYAHSNYRPNYNRGVGPYDIGLLQLASPAELNDYVKLALLPEENDHPEGRATLSGWGLASTLSNVSPPTRLQTADFTIVDWPECREFVTNLNPTGLNTVRESNLCVGLDVPGIASCQGDSGGPLIQNSTTSDQAVVIGIVSWGYSPCGRILAPSVFTRVSYYTSWIQSMIA